MIKRQIEHSIKEALTDVSLTILKLILGSSRIVVIDE